MSSSINLSEVEKFSKVASEWWDYDGPLKTLHDINHCRVKYIVDVISNKFSINNLDILDIGCGGGIVCEPLSRLGANVVGIDASKENIAVAKAHAKEMKLAISYLQSTIERFVEKKKTFDCITCLEVLEHVDSVDEFIKNCCKALNKKGIIFFSTINRNLKSYLTTIMAAEYILKWLPVGTHEWKKFIKPSELSRFLSREGAEIKEIKGIEFKPISAKDWVTTDDISVNYILYAVKR
ncbi:MAG: bifunctional 2-polyprenyl-6-hydroxyphenol methylase/3-demethylubiquinol 3-O-methyltransferase UbiG [Rickettsiales bacterium]